MWTGVYSRPQYYSCRFDKQDHFPCSKQSLGDEAGIAQWCEHWPLTSMRPDVDVVRLFRELSLPEKSVKVHGTTPKGIVGSFKFLNSEPVRNFEIEKSRFSLPQYTYASWNFLLFLSSEEKNYNKIPASKCNLQWHNAFLGNCVQRVDYAVIIVVSQPSS